MPEPPRFARVELSVPSKQRSTLGLTDICFERRRRRSSVLVIKEAESPKPRRIFRLPLETLLAIRRIRLSAVIRARNLASHAASPRSLPRLSG